MNIFLYKQNIKVHLFKFYYILKVFNKRITFLILEILINIVNYQK